MKPTASDAAGIDGRNQTLETYARVLDVRRDAFLKFMTENHPDLNVMDEADWDDQFAAWCELDSAWQ
jgi:hypothetical protein